MIRTDRMGDVLLNVPAIRALKQRFNAYIVALVAPELKELMESFPEIDRVLPFDEENWQKGIPARFQLLRRIRKERFDLAVILNPARRFHVLTCLAGIPMRLGYNRKWGFLLTHKIEDKKSLGLKHEVEYNLDLVRHIGADTEDKGISIKADREDARFVEELLAKSGIKNEDLLIAVHPHSTNPAKCWPRKNFVLVMDELSRRFAVKVVLIGGKEETNAAIEMLSLTACRPVNLSGLLSLKQLSAFFRRCVLLISNDSGPVHIAAASDASAVVIFGRNIPGVGPKRWGPWGKGHIILHEDPGCNPCLDRNCPYGFKCLTSISSEDVLTAVEKQLKRVN